MKIGTDINPLNNNAKPNHALRGVCASYRRHLTGLAALLCTLRYGRVPYMLRFVMCHLKGPTTFLFVCGHFTAYWLTMRHQQLIFGSHSAPTPRNYSSILQRIWDASKLCDFILFEKRNIISCMRMQVMEWMNSSLLHVSYRVRWFLVLFTFAWPNQHITWITCVRSQVSDRRRKKCDILHKQTLSD